MIHQRPRGKAWNLFHPGTTLACCKIGRDFEEFGSSEEALAEIVAGIESRLSNKSLDSIRRQVANETHSRLFQPTFVDQVENSAVRILRMLGVKPRRWTLHNPPKPSDCFAGQFYLELPSPLRRLTDHGCRTKRSGITPEELMFDDAINVLWQVFAARKHLLNGQADEAFAHGVRIGRILSVAQFRSEEPAARTGRTVLKAASAGHTAIHGTTEAKAARWIEQQNEVNKVRTEHPTASAAFVRRIAAQRLTARGQKVSDRTLRRHTIDQPKK